MLLIQWEGDHRGQGNKIGRNTIKRKTAVLTIKNKDKYCFARSRVLVLVIEELQLQLYDRIISKTWIRTRKVL